MIRELIENMRVAWKFPLRAKYFWFRGLFSKERSCGKKVRYSNESAQRAKEKMTFRKIFDVYRCIWCGSYHIGGSIQRYMKEEK
jgi:hypothetical protein